MDILNSLQNDPFSLNYDDYSTYEDVVPEDVVPSQEPLLPAGVVDIPPPPLSESTAGEGDLIITPSYDQLASNLSSLKEVNSNLVTNLARLSDEIKLVESKYEYLRKWGKREK